MQVWISAEMDCEVAEAFRIANCELEDELAAFLGTREYDIELDSFDCIAIIRNDTALEEVHRYSPKRRDMDFRLAIDFEQFRDSSQEERKSLILDMLIRAAELLALKKCVPREEAMRLKQDLVNFAERL